MDALFARAARLPKVPFVAPERVISQTTVGGAPVGPRLRLRRPGRRDRRPDPRRARRSRRPGDRDRRPRRPDRAALATITAVDPELTLQGLRLVWERNARVHAARPVSCRVAGAGSARLQPGATVVLRTSRTVRPQAADRTQPTEPQLRRRFVRRVRGTLTGTPVAPRRTSLPSSQLDPALTPAQDATAAEFSGLAAEPTRNVAPAQPAPATLERAWTSPRRRPAPAPTPAASRRRRSRSAASRAGPRRRDPAARPRAARARSAPRAPPRAGAARPPRSSAAARAPA